MKGDEYSDEASDDDVEEEEDDFGMEEGARPGDLRTARSNKAKLKKLEAYFEQYCNDIKKDELKKDYRFTDLRNTQYKEISKMFVYKCY